MITICEEANPNKLLVTPEIQLPFFLNYRMKSLSNTSVEKTVQFI